ncbi:MAG: AbrB/MazE/SpoVT family DNA-binding domain-containing protein [Defluviitaleaceae bacterium]|nr:AbrB/MazE/SpoVT family DNA-binding domain-containing protein [Defluviitaleaceae bacterium]
MELAKISNQGQLTLPINIMRKLNLQKGGKIAFIEREGVYTIVNPVTIAINELQTAFEGEAEKLDLKSEADVVALVKEIRQNVWEACNADNG